MNKRSLLLSLMLSATPVVSASQALATVPLLDVPGVGATANCLVGGVQKPVLHFDKVIFKIAAGGLVPIFGGDNGPLNALPRLTELDIKVRDNPTKIADLKGKVLTFLGAQNIPGNRALITIVDVEYAVICGSLPQ